MNYFADMPVYVTTACNIYEFRQYRWPASRRMRIRKKFAKKYVRRVKVGEKMYQVGNALYVGYDGLEELRKLLTTSQTQSRFGL